MNTIHDDNDPVALARGDQSALQSLLVQLRMSLSIDASLLADMYGVDDAEIMSSLDASLQVAEVQGTWTIARAVRVQGPESATLRDILFNADDGEPFTFSGVCAYLWSILESAARRRSKKYKDQQQKLWRRAANQAPSSSSEQKELDDRETLRRLMSRLTEIEQQAVRLCRVAGLHQQVVADSLNLTRRQLQRVLTHAESKLADQIEF